MGRQKNGSLIYKSLPANTIRVLDILPGSFSDPICVKLHAVSLRHLQPYKALSYTWGSETEGLQDIRCNGYDFKATANLFSALRRFRHSSETIRMWVDAICIDQSSTNERSQQVRLMRDIYRNAEEVLLWLGEENPDVNVELLFEVAQNRYDYALQKQILIRPPGPSPVLLLSRDVECVKILEQVGRDRNFLDPSSIPSTVKSEINRINGSGSHRVMYVGSKQSNQDPTAGENQAAGAMLGIMPDFDLAHVKRAAASDYATIEDFLLEATKPPQWLLSDKQMAEVLIALSELTSRPYFQRAWIVQEILVSTKTTMICGEHRIEFHTFAAVFSNERYRHLDLKNFILDDFEFLNPQRMRQILTRLIALPIQIQNRAHLLSKQRGRKVPSSICHHRLQARNGHLNRLTMAELLTWYGGQQASDPKDHIFSLVGLILQYSSIVEEIEWGSDLVDYSLDCRKVFLKAAEHIVATHRPRISQDAKPSAHHILTFFATESGKSSVSTPSWVPNWSSQHREPVVLNTRRIFEIDTLIPYSPKVQGDSLFLAGHYVDEVTFVSGTLTHHEQHLYREVQLCNDLMSDISHSVYGSAEEQFDAFWRTIIADNPLGTKSLQDYTYHFQEQDAVRDWLSYCRTQYDRISQIWSYRLDSRHVLGPLLSSSRVNVFQQTPDQKKAGGLISGNHATVLIPTPEITQCLAKYHADDDAVDPTKAFRDLCDQPEEPEWRHHIFARMEYSPHQFVKTKKGYFGLATPDVKIGDSMVLLAGSASPWYLRPVGNHYVIAGQGWVHGLQYHSDKYHEGGWKKGDIKDFEIR